MNRQTVEAGGGVAIDTTVEGDGPALVVVPSYGRDCGRDFDDFTRRAVAAGFTVLRPQPRGIAGSRGPTSGVSMHDLAADVAAVIRKLAAGPVVLVGHAFGNMLSRMVATDHPALVKAVVLAAAQASEVPPDIEAAPLIAGNPAAPEAERLEALRKAFFAPGHDPSAWLTGWYPETLQMEVAAGKTVPVAEYEACGDVPLLELIPACDPFKAKPFWHELRERYPGRVTSVVIEDAGHALFPEQPGAVADAVLPWLALHR